VSLSLTYINPGSTAKSTQYTPHYGKFPNN